VVVVIKIQIVKSYDNERYYKIVTDANFVRDTTGVCNRYNLEHPLDLINVPVIFAFAGSTGRVDAA
jgi:hypothetical protein